MKKELEQKLFEKYPLFFKHIDNTMASLMIHGFECGDGWYNLLNTTFRKIKKYYINKYSEIPNRFYIIQVKQKYGLLRIYSSLVDKEVFDILDEAEAKSSRVCELCGKKGKLREDLHYIRTLCDDCYKMKLREEREEMEKILEIRRRLK